MPAVEGIIINTPETRPMAAIAFTEGAYQLPLATSVKYPSAVE